MKFIRKLGLTLNCLAAALLLISYFAPAINPDKYWQFGILGLIFPFMIFVNISFIIFWLFSKTKINALISLVIIMLGWSAFSGVIGLKLPTDIPPNKKAIKVMTYNIRAMSLMKNYPTKNLEKNKENFIFYIEENGLPDVFCVQETTVPNIKFMTNAFNLPYVKRHSGYNSQSAILSKYIIDNSGEIKFDEGNGDCVWADISIEGSSIRFYSFHLHSNTISVQADSIFDVHNINQKKAVEGAKGMFSKYKYSARIRNQQATKIKNHIKSSPLPVVVCGDLNDTPQSFVYHTMVDGLKDCFKERGIGFGTTWAGNPPGLKIDYIFVSDTIETFSNTILKRRFSDHYPIVATMSFIDRKL